MHTNGTAAAEQTEIPPPSGLYAYAVQTIQARLQRMLALVDDVRRSEETEPVHKMRVASRRTRAALDIFDLSFSGGDYARLEREVKRITGVLSEARDLDVMQAKLADHLLELPQEQRPGLQSLIDQLHERREKAQKTVDKTLRRIESQDLEACFKAIATRDDHSRADDPGRPTSRRAGTKEAQGGNGHG